MSEESTDSITSHRLIETENERSQWINLSFYVITASVVLLYVVMPAALSLLVKQPEVEQPISEVNMILNLLLSQFPLIVVLMMLAFAVQRSMSIRDKFSFKNWRWSYLIIPFGLELLILPAIWLVTRIFLFVSERFFDTSLETGPLEAFLMECSDSTLIYMAVGAVIIAPVIEELIFRKIIYDFVKKYSSTIAATIFTSLLFAVIHCSLIKIPALFVIALFLQAVYNRYKSIYPAILLHVVHNGITFLLLIVFRAMMKDESTRALLEQYL